MREGGDKRNINRVDTDINWTPYADLWSVDLLLSKSNCDSCYSGVEKIS